MRQAVAREASCKGLMTKDKQRSWRRLLVGGIVILVVFALVAAAAILLTDSPDSSASKTKRSPAISLEEWLGGSLSPKSFNGTWISAKPPNINNLRAIVKWARASVVSE
ncbi:hypothetical protein KM043_017105 [Ampulex compressa]|nr:hypothetical protein KM043_017105 [Ampulex compressa]